MDQKELTKELAHLHLTYGLDIQVFISSIMELVDEFSTFYHGKDLEEIENCLDHLNQANNLLDKLQRSGK